MNGSEQSDSGLFTLAPRRRWMRYVWLIGLLVLAAGVWFLGWDRIRAALSAARWQILLAAVAVDAAALWLRAFKWRYALGTGKGAIGLFFMAKAAGNWSPGRAGEFLPVLLPAYRNSAAASWIVFDMLLEALATIIAGTLGVVLFRAGTNWGYLPVLAGAVVVILALLWGLSRTDFLRRLRPSDGSGGIVGKALSILAVVSGEIAALRTKFPLIGLFTVAAVTLELTANVLLFAAFGWAVPFAAVAMAKCAHGIIAAVPFTPSISGVPYVMTAVLLYQTVGVPYETLIVSLAAKEAFANVVFWTSFGGATLDIAGRSSKTMRAGGSHNG